MTQVLVSKDVLEAVLREMVDLREAYAIEGGAHFPSQGEVMYLHPEDEVVTLAVEAGIVIPGELEPGTVPPAPPQHPFDVGKVFELIAQCEDRMGGAPDEGFATAGTYRADGDDRLRCIADGKVVYGTERAARSAAATISQREQMKSYLGQCGHYHVSRVKRVDVPWAK